MKQLAQDETTHIVLEIPELVQEAIKNLSHRAFRFSVHLVYFPLLESPWMVVFQEPLRYPKSLRVTFYVFDTSSFSPWEDSFQEVLERSLSLNEKLRILVSLQTVRLRVDDDIGCKAFHIVRSLSRLPDIDAVHFLLNEIKWGDPLMEHVCGPCVPDPEGVITCRFQKIVDWINSGTDI